MRCASAQGLDGSGTPMVADRVLQVPADERTGLMPVVTALAASHDGKLLASGGDDHIVRIWDRETGKITKNLRGHTDWVRTAEFHPDNKRLITAADDHTIRLWNLDNDESTVLFETTGPSYCLCFRADGKELAHAGFANTVSVLDVEKREVIQQLEAPSNDVRAMLFAPQAAMLAAAGRNGKIRVWQGNELKFVRDIDAHRQRVRTMAFSPDGAYLASGGEDRQLVIWNVASGTEAFRLPLRPGRIHCVAYCGASLLAVGTSDNVIRIWDLQQRVEVMRMLGHTGSIAALIYVADASELISAGFDTSIRIWKLTPEAGARVAQQPVTEDSSRIVR
ncbi:MAG TPA: WD40 repeat domain-containing protein [Pirellulales bacterium]|nr:WD40 repeat domain-containing protein [Pirellulales bacterium]